jgi:hypothetical protein
VQRNVGANELARECEWRIGAGARELPGDEVEVGDKEGVVKICATP